MPDTDDDLFRSAPLPIAPLDGRERLACLRLIRSENVGPITFRALVNHYGGATRALEALPDIARRAGRQKPIRICPVATAEQELEAAHRAGLTPLFTIEPGYPAALAAVDVPPPLLYARGDVGLLNRPAVGMVGSRQASAAGHALARQIATGLGAAGYVVVSGLARGIDAAAHHASLASGTVAVLAGGLDVIYPPENAELHHQIGEQGCLISEQPPGFVPRAKDFPRRNRIISGIALGVIVIEAARRSGSLITARMAAEQGREVFAVPGHPLDPRAEGTNDLLKSGATLVTCAADVVSALTPLHTKSGPGLADGARAAWIESSQAQARAATEPALYDGAAPPGSALEAGGARRPTAPVRQDNARDAKRVAPAGSPSEPSDRDRALVLAALGPAPVAVDALARACDMPAGLVRAALLELSLAGEIEHHGSQLVSRRPV